MNEGIFGESYGAPLRAERVRFKTGQGAAQYMGEALVLKTTDQVSGQVNRYKGSATADIDRCDLVLPLPITVGRAGQSIAGPGAISVQVPDGGPPGGNVRGFGAVDLQARRSAATQVAAGLFSFVVGSTNTANGNYAVALGNGNNASSGGSVAIGAGNTATAAADTAIGISNTASGGASTAIGSSNAAGGMSAVALGEGNSVGGQRSFAAGYGNNANGSASVALGHMSDSNSIGGKFTMGCVPASQGSAQTGLVTLSANSTSATPVVLTSSQSAASSVNQLVLPNNGAQAFMGVVVARQQGVGGTASAAWKVEGLIRREGSAATTVLVANTVTAISNAPGWALALTADTTNGGLAVTFTGAAATNTRCTASLHTSETLY
jgi:hypothetical protein